MALTFQRSPTILATDMDGDLVMMNIERGEYVGLKGIGPRLWALLEQPGSVDDLVAVVTREYEIDDATCRRDIQGFLDQMIAKGMVLECAA